MSIVIPNGGRSIVERMAEKFPEFYVNDDEQQRVLTTRIAQQYASTYGGGVWGLKKRASLPAGSPVSKDSLAHFAGGALSLWDLFQGAEPPPILIVDGKVPDFTNPPDAEFVPVDPVNWLSDVIAPAPGPDPVPTTPVDLAPVLARLDAQAGELAALRGLVQQLLDRPAPPVVVPPFPAYAGSINLGYFGNRSVRLEPQL